MFDAFKNLQFISCFFDGFVIIRLKSYLQQTFFIISLLLSFKLLKNKRKYKNQESFHKLDFFLQHSTITEVPEFHLHLQVKKLKLKCHTCMHMCVCLQSSPSNVNVVVQEDQRRAVTAIFQERITARYFIKGDLGICFEVSLLRMKQLQRKGGA